MDYQLTSIITIEKVEIFDAFPKIENHVGDIPYTPEEVLVSLAKIHARHPDSCVSIKALSVSLVLMLGVIVGLLGGKVMYYIPLYIALMPVVYCLLKIGYAHYLVKKQKLHVGSESFSGKTHG
ncbi:hypothetical protein [Cedecea neteri]|uniref:hypothetical protein n=1 Tax=Cedecea neteri TaxID=158822 RepID=UPI00289C50BE|nr:hypothetical protein [Cedecea neteri]